MGYVATSDGVEILGAGQRPAERVHRTVGALFRGRLGHPNAVPAWTGRGDSSIFISDAAFVASLKDVKQDPSLAVAVVSNAATAYLALTESARMRDGERILPAVSPSEVSKRYEAFQLGEKVMKAITVPPRCRLSRGTRKRLTRARTACRPGSCPWLEMGERAA